MADKIGEYDPELFLAEDYEYWIRAYLTGTLKHIPKNLYDYGRHEKSLTSTRMKDIYQKTYQVKEKHFNELLNRCKTQDEINRFYWEMLDKLTNKREKKNVQKAYYARDSFFAKADKKKRKREALGTIIRSVMKVVTKFKKDYKYN